MNFASIKSALALLASNLWAYFKPAAEVFGTKAGKALLSMVEKAVIAAATSEDLKTNADRRNWVAEQVKASDLNTGNKFADSLINLAIELAVTKLKNTK